MAVSSGGTHLLAALHAQGTACWRHAQAVTHLLSRACMCQVLGSPARGSKPCLKAWLHVNQAHLSAGIRNADEHAIGTTDLVAVAEQERLHVFLQLPDDFPHITPSRCQLWGTCCLRTAQLLKSRSTCDKGTWRWQSAWKIWNVSATPPGSCDRCHSWNDSWMHF